MCETVLLILFIYTVALFGLANAYLRVEKSFLYCPFDLPPDLFSPMSLQIYYNRLLILKKKKKDSAMGHF